MRIKKGVNLAGIQPEIVLAMVIAAGVFRDMFGFMMEITEGTGGKHGYGSLHYVGLASDNGIKGLNKEQAVNATLEIRERLGENYDVVLESDHIHIEFQPK